MMRTSLAIFGVAATAGVAVILAIAARGRDAPHTGDEQPVRLVRPAKEASAVAQRRVRGCSASSCHGGEAGEGTPSRSAYTVWAFEDPHATAYLMLFTDRSRRMIRRLTANAETANSAPQQPGAARDDRVYLAHLEKYCTACHAPRGAFGQSDSEIREVSSLRAGVGCQNCHGDAAGWIDEHTRSTWEAKTPEEKRKHGFNNTQEIAFRARLCASCHVGSAGRDVNHDLLAAGHPQLRFELTAYLDALPKHWSTERDDELQLWTAGQIASAKAALELLQTRASEAEKALNEPLAAPNQSPQGGPVMWPEFAEYACSSCHHNLQTDPRDWPSRSPGVYKWDGWLFAMPRLLPRLQDPGFPTALDQLASVMENPFPDPEAARVHSARLSQALADPGAFAWDGDAARTDFLQASARPMTWTESVQWYLAVMALHRQREAELRDRGAPATAEDEALARALQDLRQTLESPSNKPTDLAAAVQRVRNLLPPPRAIP